MGSNFDTIFAAAHWPAALAELGETISHDPVGATAAYNATLIFDDGSIVGQKGGKVSAAISGPKAAFAVTPDERDTFVRGSEVYACVEVEDDKAGGWRCWVRRKS